MPKKSRDSYWNYQEWGIKGVEFHVNEPLPQYPGYSADVEDDGKGNFVSLGLYNPIAGFYYYTDKSKLPDLSKTTLIGHVFRTDLAKLRKWGVNTDNIQLPHDTALTEHLQDPTQGNYGLKDLCKKKFGVSYPEYKQIVGEGNLLDVPSDVVMQYNACDTYYTYKLWEEQKLQSRHAYYGSVMWPLGEVLNAMEEKGMLIDKPKLHAFKNEIQIQRENCLKDVQKVLGEINLNSPKQLIEALGKVGITPKYKNKVSVDKRGLTSLQGNPVIDKLLQYSELETLLTSFIEPYLQIEGDIIHPFFSQTATRTGRLACYRPNLQQVPKRTANGKKLKECFVARPGHVLIEADYGQIEPRLLAHESGCKALNRIFLDGVDFHDFTAGNIAKDRDTAKVVNLSAGYRATAWSFMFQLKCTKEEAFRIHRDWWRPFPDLYEWEDRLIKDARFSGVVKTLMGRTIPISNLESPDKKVKASAERQVIENYAQASAQEIIQVAMLNLHKAGFSLINQIHDSVVIEVPKSDLEVAAHEIKTIMEDAVELRVPLTVDIKYGENWGQMWKVK